MFPKQPLKTGGQSLLHARRIVTNGSTGTSRFRSHNVASNPRTSIQQRHLATPVNAGIWPPHPNDAFMQTNNASYMEEMYQQWRKAPETVHHSWRTYFNNMENGKVPAAQAFQPAPGWIPSFRTEGPPMLGSAPLQPVNQSNQSNLQSTEINRHLKVQLLVRAYQARGHEKAAINPLEVRDLRQNLRSDTVDEVDWRYYGFTEADLDAEFDLNPGILPRFLHGDKSSMTLREIIAACEKTYCGKYAVEYLHIPDRAKCDWIRERIEVPNPIQYSVEQKKQILDRLIWSAMFEKFLATKFPNEKRYGLEGGETLGPGVKALIDASVLGYGVEEIVIGSQHRGRLGMLANLIRKPMESLFLEFSAGGFVSHESEAGDVKTHLGMNCTREYPGGESVHISLLANPSHLEAENPVAAGKVKAIQRVTRDESQSKTLYLNLHGDAAISGQGVVYETQALSKLPAFDVGGTIHVIVNNQIGFTTEPQYSRSTTYCSDIAKSINAPIFHVNADDAEAVTFVCKLAADWRAKFKTDVFVDLICYRKSGHNEMDQPMFTQPYLYDQIAKKIPSLDLYIQQLVREGTFSQAQIDEHKSRIWDFMSERFDASKDYQRSNIEWNTSSWPSMKSPQEVSTEILPAKPTAITTEALKTVTDKIATVPTGFVTHHNVQRVLDARQQALQDGENVDWSTAEALAFGTLCMEGYHVRVSGEDVERGTFSQRHAVVHNQRYTPMNGELQKWAALDHLTPDQARFDICNSPLSEYGVLGFEYGYSLASPKSLVMWEAQFGDFANTAQVITDQFISGGETKWLQRSGLVMSLPHGFDGQGPEHSSARLERFLQLCNEDSRVYPSPDKMQRIHQDCNMQVVYMTTPANLFHVLRRQVHREFRKPLIIFFSKSLLRHPLTRSNIAEFTGDSKFQPVIPDPDHSTDHINPPNKIRRVILCSGQVYAALTKHRADHSIRDVAITRIEQIHPFPWEQVKQNLERYENADTEIAWCQEEHMNGGAWSHVQGRIQTVLKEIGTHEGKEVKYIGRDPCATTATGAKSVHDKQQKKLMADAFA